RARPRHLQAHWGDGKRLELGAIRAGAPSFTRGQSSCSGRADRRRNDGGSMTKRILVVEDTEDNRQIVRDLLSSVGYELIEAVDGAQGVAMAQSEHPDLILMDIQLPEIDGY